tara:strand:- start:797 stop:1090 length:294 start_codon:yes stop_codon:yes gene_type:complete
MRVNVTYSVNIDEVMDVVKNLLKEASLELEQIFKDFPEVVLHIEGEEEDKAAEVINKCRERLVTLEHCLGDSQSILTGYKQTLSQIKKEVEDAPTSG